MNILQKVLLSLSLFLSLSIQLDLFLLLNRKINWWWWTVEQEVLIKNISTQKYLFKVWKLLQHYISLHICEGIDSVIMLLYIWILLYLLINLIPVRTFFYPINPFFTHCLEFSQPICEVILIGFPCRSVTSLKYHFSFWFAFRQKMQEVVQLDIMMNLDLWSMEVNVVIGMNLLFKGKLM